MKQEAENKKDVSPIPESSPSKAMDSKKDVEQSNDPKTDEDFPGYPHHPSKEKIIKQEDDYIKEENDVEKNPDSKNTTGVGQRFLAGQDKEKAEEAMIPGPATDDALGTKDRSSGNKENDQMDVLNAKTNETGKPQNVTNNDLKNRNAGNQST